MDEEQRNLRRVISKLKKQKILLNRRQYQMLSIIIFVDVGPKLASKIQHTGKNYYDYLIKPAQTCIYTKPTVPEEIAKIIGKFIPNKSPSHDDITNMVFKI